ncbi:hypothetical protein [Cellulomonas sp. P24]|uniref:hypothetical protein n=1 Tax=Cellulomonas sp. P24 TaxID=2885206 RepID=UPI00216B5AC4|nr:hypothetical protein [Cellulomonas sp. P24]MCR6494514.1 hypothetical protein [Cellulomonas sp. P24]
MVDRADRDAGGGHAVDGASALVGLQTPDSRTLAVTPWGLGLGVAMRAEDSASMWAEEAGRLRLADDVAEGTRRAFAELAGLLPYGLLHYSLFTLIHDRVLFVLELALRDRFVEHHQREHDGYVEFRRNGRDYPTRVDKYGDVVAQARRLGRGAEIAVQPPGRAESTVRFNGSFSALIVWARELEFLFGQRSAAAENVIRKLRNDVAHPDGYRLLWPGDVLLTLRDLAEIINHMWGHVTPGGRLYPGPVERHTVALAWSENGDSCATLARNLADPGDWDGYSQFALVMATWPGSADLHEYDSRFEVTAAPVGYLWGPGSRGAALEYLEANPPRRDSATMLDRRFLVRVDADRIWQPMRPEIAAALAGEATGGNWHLIRADTPAAALRHVRALVCKAECTDARTCPVCHAGNLASGPLQSMLCDAGEGARVLPPDFRLPSLVSGSRWLSVEAGAAT